MKTESLSSVTEAIKAWTGYGRISFPWPDDDAFSTRYGINAAHYWLPILHALKDEFYRSDANIRATSLDEMGQLASEQFAMAHPELDEEVVRVLSWCYTYDNR